MLNREGAKDAKVLYESGTTAGKDGCRFDSNKYLGLRRAYSFRLFTMRFIKT
jgi:hypothetical protein